MKKIAGRILATVVIVVLAICLLLPGRIWPKEKWAENAGSTAVEGELGSDQPDDFGETEEVLPQALKDYEKEANTYRDEKGNVEYDREDPSTWIINPDFYKEPGEEIVDSLHGISYRIEAIEYADHMDDYPSGNYAKFSFSFLAEDGSLIPTYERKYKDDSGQMVSQETEQKILKIRLTASNLYDEVTETHFAPSFVPLKQVGNEPYYDYTRWERYQSIDSDSYDPGADDTFYRVYLDGQPFYVRCSNREESSSEKALYRMNYGPGETVEMEYAFLIDPDLMEEVYLCFNFTGTRYDYYEISYFLVPLPEER